MHKLERGGVRETKLEHPSDIRWPRSAKKTRRRLCWCLLRLWKSTCHSVDHIQCVFTFQQSLFQFIAQDATHLRAPTRLSNSSSMRRRQSTGLWVATSNERTPNYAGCQMKRQSVRPNGRERKTWVDYYRNICFFLFSLFAMSMVIHFHPLQLFLNGENQPLWRQLSNSWEMQATFFSSVSLRRLSA